jgi:hypothetical protein
MISAFEDISEIVRFAQLRSLNLVNLLGTAKHGIPALFADITPERASSKTTKLFAVPK